MAENENEYENENIRNNNGNSGLEDVTDFIFRHKIAVIGILSLIPILAFTIIGFKNNHYIKINKLQHFGLIFCGKHSIIAWKVFDFS